MTVTVVQSDNAMVARKVIRKDTKEKREVWMIDITFQHSDGKRERIRRVAKIQNKREAEREDREILTDLVKNGKYVPVSEQPIDEPTPTTKFNNFSEEFLSVYAVNNNKLSEQESKESILRVHLRPFFGELPLEHIDPEKIEKYKAQKLKEKVAPKTINNHLTVLRCLLSVAVEWKKILFVPKIKWLKCPEPEFDFFTFDEKKQLVSKSQNSMWDLMILVGLEAGLRLGEILGLRWCDIDFVNRKIVVRQAVSRGVVGTPKNGKKREVPLTDTLYNALKAYRHLKSEFVFCHDDGSMITKGQTKWPLYSACRRAGLRRGGWHVLRHTFASHLIMLGASLKAVQELLGHATIEMTMKYAHLSASVKRDAIDLLNSQGNNRATDEQKQEAS